MSTVNVDGDWIDGSINCPRCGNFISTHFDDQGLPAARCSNCNSSFDKSECIERNWFTPDNQESLKSFIKRRIVRNDQYNRIGAGALLSKNNKTYYIPEDPLRMPLKELPHSVVDQLKRGRGLGYLRNHIDSMFKINKSRAPAFAERIDEELGSDSYDFELEQSVYKASIARKQRPPMIIARQGQTIIMAWLAAHGFSNGSIARALDVSESTVKVNLSKFKNK